ncbi:hypothetical protein CXB51_009530 [Gossypium anomalum]|uniref:Gag-pol polyprotein n=1 Tax=Gossypium anomalum TaxID=47600 RepID=A0A8J6D4Z5_9ROSI|nr:hypothetical protein CXB51_009530 [Gossypium anomalum]
MQGSQTIEDFYAKLCDLSYQAFAPGEEYLNTKLVRKMLRYLPKRFSIKVTFSKEAKELKSLAIDELIGSLQTFEINLEDIKRNKIKYERSITFQVVGTAKLDDENLDGDLDMGLDEEFLKTYKMEAKESLIAEELDNFVKGKRTIKGGLGFVDKGKAVMESPIVFVKASGLKEVSERQANVFQAIQEDCSFP